MTSGKMLRPRAEVLPDAALVPPRNLISPPPDCFTHALARAQPYYYDEARAAGAPDGTFARGTHVVLLTHAGGALCRVADAQGLYVATAYDGLEPLG